jgi:membrane protein
VGRLGAATGSFDSLQQRHRWLAFPIAVWRKFGDDQAGNLAALVAYYAFLSTFPLLLVLVTVLGLVLAGNPGLQQDVLNSALAEFPLIGTQLRQNVHSLGRNGFGLAVGLVFTLYGARGVANAMQNAMNEIWEIPHRARPGFPANMLRSFGLIGVIGLGVLVTTALSGVGSWSGHTFFGPWGKVLVIAVSLVLNIGVFWLGLRVATSSQVGWRELRTGAILSAVVWQVLQYVGGYVVAHSLRNSTALYGTFGLVLGLLAWLQLQAQLTLYAVEADVVRARKLWPRSLFPPPLTDEDRKALHAYAQVEERLPETRIETHFQDRQDGDSDGDGNDGKRENRENPEGRGEE